ncbi:methyl-accepting chemotaxis protein [Sporomusa sp. KB1]|jgi:methyl-accepting chemotaxis protein|uniref:methyl-accepting chemotaxis protein n=1 Tax=Sporomusa sp. KB1 TaxID=943346 RepID=UPI0011A03EEE|nr:methyl-accepting chemotaxis protein [Sporomusa sp. KB1]TWH46750.1 methyl-accepting chemotaxis protein [Sporomusa sp. KB1]
MKSIQAKLTVTILIIIFVALSALGGLNYWKAREIITQSITGDMEKMAENSAEDVGNWMESRKSELALMAAAPMIKNGDKAAIVPFLANAVKAHKVYDAMSYVSLDGNFISSSGITGSLVDRDYFKKALQGEPVISDPVQSKVSGKWIVVVVVPVKADGKLTGLFQGNVDITGLASRVQSIKAGQTGYAYILKNDGLVITHQDQEVAMKANYLKDSNTPPALTAISERMVKGETGLSRYEYGGNDKIIAFAPVGGTDWSMAITVPATEVTGAVSALTTISLITIFAVLIITAIIIAWFSRRIARPIQALEAAVNRIANGDIAQVNLNISSKDEIGRLGNSFEQMTKTLRGLIRKIHGATDQVAASSEELTASAEQAARAADHIAAAITTVANGADEQLVAADNASTVVAEMSAGIQQIAASTQQVAAQSAQAAGKAKEGDRAVDDATTQMDQIEETVNSSAKVVAKLGERSKEIGQIVDTISGIAGQTNLLALNAAIEAARAGEAGRGFAVVAEEVRKLAEQSQEAAKRIAELIGQIQGDTDKAVVAMDEGTREVKTGAEVVKKAGAAFREIAGLVTEVSDQVKEISASIQQLANGSQRIVGAVQTIDGLGKKSAGEAQGVSAAAEEQLASMEEIASSGQSLAKLAQDLQTDVASFRL